MRNTEDYIIPTTSRPTFTADCDYFGYIERNVYKYTYVEKANCTVNTWATSYRDAVNSLLEWIEENPHILEEYPKAKFNIDMYTGGVNKHGEMYRESVFQISAYRAKRVLGIL